MLFGLFKNPEVFNGYGLKRWDYKKPHISVGFVNKVHIFSSFPYSGMCYFAHAMKRFPLKFSFCFGYLDGKPKGLKSGLYFQGSIARPYDHFKLLFFKKVFIGFDSPKWLIKLQHAKDERKFERMNAAYDKYMEEVGE